MVVKSIIYLGLSVQVKKHRCWVKRDDLSPALHDYVDTKKLP